MWWGRRGSCGSAGCLSVIEVVAMSNLNEATFLPHTFLMLWQATIHLKPSPLMTSRELILPMGQRAGEKSPFLSPRSMEHD